MTLDEMIKKLNQLKQEGVDGNTDILFDIGCEEGDIVTDIYYNNGDENSFWLGKFVVIVGE